MNPASVMKLVTTFAALELLGRDYRWKTEAYLGRPARRRRAARRSLILKGYGDPKITIEQWQSFMADLRAKGLDRVDRRPGARPVVVSSRQPHDPAEFDKEPLKPYNVGPDALLVSFKSVRFVFAPNAAGDAVELRAEPALPEVALGPPPTLVAGDCTTGAARCWRTFVNRGATARRRSRAATRRTAASATGTWRCSTIRISSTACSRPTSATPADSSTAA